MTRLALLLLLLGATACIQGVTDALVGDDAAAVDTVLVSSPPDTVVVVFYCHAKHHHRWECRR